MPAVWRRSRPSTRRSGARNGVSVSNERLSGHAYHPLALFRPDRTLEQARDKPDQPGASRRQSGRPVGIAIPPGNRARHSGAAGHHHGPEAAPGSCGRGSFAGDGYGTRSRPRLDPGRFRPPDRGASGARRRRAGHERPADSKALSEGSLVTMMTNRLYYGDNLEILRKEIKDESVDLIYLDRDD